MFMQTMLYGSENRIAWIDRKELFSYAGNAKLYNEKKFYLFYRLWLITFFLHGSICECDPRRKAGLKNGEKIAHVEALERAFFNCHFTARN